MNAENPENMSQETDKIPMSEKIRNRAAALFGYGKAWEEKEDPTPPEIESDSIYRLSAIQGIKAVTRADGKGFNATVEGQAYFAPFGRDTGHIAESVLWAEPELVEGAIFSLAERQGTRDDIKSEEDIGKIHHEERSGDYGTNLANIAIGKYTEFTAMSEKTKPSGETVHISYVSADSTPLYIKLVSDYCEKFGTAILDKKVTGFDGKEITIGESVEAATKWIESKVDPEGYVEVERRSSKENPYGQSWKDSATAYIRPDGTRVNTSGRIVYPEIQALSIDALEGSANLTANTDPELAARRKQEAHNLRLQTLNMWSEEDGFFISCLEEGNNGELVPVTTHESSCGRLLNSSLFDELSEEEKQHYQIPIITKLFSNDFLTEGGIRTRALEYGKELNVADYHGSYVTWAIDTFLIAEGLRRQGFNRLAEQLENRLINATNMAGKAYEFLFVNEEGKPILDYKGKKTGRAGEISVQMAPQKSQGWTFSSIINIKRRRGAEAREPEISGEETWQTELENQILSQIEDIQIYKSREEMAANYPEKISDTKIKVISGVIKTGLHIARGSLDKRK